MKKIIILSSALCLLASYSANAGTTTTVIVGEPIYTPSLYVSPGYRVAPPWPSEHYDIHNHRHNDYWGHIDEERREQMRRADGNNDNYNDRNHYRGDRGRR